MHMSVFCYNLHRVNIRIRAASCKLTTSVYFQKMRLSRVLWNQLKHEEASVERMTHIPVMAKEISQLLNPRDGQCFIDMTFGGGGHTRHLLMSQKKITIFALDRDPQAFQRAIVLSKSVAARQNGQTVVPLLGRFSELGNLLNNFNIPFHRFDGAIMDLGTSAFQVEEGTRGFSLNLDGPLDMRMDADRFPNMPTAADVINSLDAEDLAKIFKVYGDEKQARKLAQSIIDARFMMKSLISTRELATLVENIAGWSATDKLGRSMHPATRIFQALRIFVNNELNELNYGLELLSRYLKKRSPMEEDEHLTEQRNDGGLLTVISFHSLEDKIVKDHITGLSTLQSNEQADYGVADSLVQHEKRSRKWRFYKERLSLPSEDEVFHNPRARSAKLRCAVRLN